MKLIMLKKRQIKIGNFGEVTENADGSLSVNVFAVQKTITIARTQPSYFLVRFADEIRPRGFRSLRDIEHYIVHELSNKKFNEVV